MTPATTLAIPSAPHLNLPAGATAAALVIIGVGLVVGHFVRKHAGGTTSAMARWPVLNRLAVWAVLMGHLNTVFGWVALLLFAAAGAAAAGTFIGQWLLDVSHGITTALGWLFEQVIGHLPGVGASTAVSLATVLLIAVLIHHEMHAIRKLLTGHLHQGGSDWLVFFGPMLFTLVPGAFGQIAAWAYGEVGAHVTPLMTSWA